MKQKILALAAALALCVSLASCTISTPDSVGSIGDVEISSGMYLLAQYSAYQTAAGYASSDQDTSKPSKFLKQTIDVGEEDAPDEQKVSDYVAAQTMETLRSYAAAEAMFDELGGELTEDEITSADSYAQQLLDSYGDTYEANGIGLTTLQQYTRNLVKSSDLLDLLYGEDGQTPVTDDELQAHMEDMVYAYYVTVPLYNTSTYVFADDDQTAEMLELCQEAATAYSSGDYSSGFAGFYTVLNEYLPQAYAVLDAEYTSSDLLNNIQLDLLSESDFEDYFNEESAATIQAMKLDEMCAVQYSDYSLIVVLRMDPSDELDSLRDTVLSDLKGDELTDKITEYGAAMTDALDASATKKLPAKKISVS
jgi:hypothetical protein